MGASPEQIGDYVANWIGDDSWVESYVGFDGTPLVTVTLKFSGKKPRTFSVVSKDSFATLDKVTIYEKDDPPVGYVKRREIEALEPTEEPPTGFAGWIPVGKGSPSHGDAVWVYDGQDVFMGEWWGQSGFHSYGASCDREGLNSETLLGITHWMEIAEPEPPNDCATSTR